MHDILAQMQEKLKATGQGYGGIGLRGRVGSLGNDLDSVDTEKKRNSIIDVWRHECNVCMDSIRLLIHGQTEHSWSNNYKLLLSEHK